MVRNTTTEDQTEKAYAQWFRAWSFLDHAQQQAVVAFCVSGDADVAEVALWL